MEEHTTCKHLDVSGCDITCACWCSDCQEQFEINWARRAEEKGLCISCGVPTFLTPETLLAEQHTHFFQPCPRCEAAFSACIAMAKLCERCHSYRGDEPCKKCTCDKTDSCACHECLTAMC